MTGKHWLCLGIGVAIGYLALPYVLSMASGAFAKKSA